MLNGPPLRAVAPLDAEAHRGEVVERVARGQGEAVAVLGAYLESRVAAGELRPHDGAATVRLLLFAVLMAHLAGTPEHAFLPAAVETIVEGLRAR